ncbi:unnamed protein product, partial [Polarella glacialis]
LLYRYTPSGVPQPWLKRLVRRHYRDAESGAHLGYAIVCYRDAAEASAVLQALDGLRMSAADVLSQEQRSGLGGLEAEALLQAVPGFQLRVRQAEHGDTLQVPLALPGTQIDPPLTEQLRPLPTSELLQRVGLLSPQRVQELPVDASHEAVLAAVAAASEGLLQPELVAQGWPLPPELAARLLAELQGLRWPARNQRPGLTSDRYLVLLSSSAPNDCYAVLRGLCAELMGWAAPEYRFSGIAVTKNFVASPHIDERDRSNQYAVSLGDFEGGELCVESMLADGARQVAVVDTRNRIARVEGRRVHWVRAFRGGDRYSLIVYDTAGHTNHHHNNHNKHNNNNNHNNNKHSNSNSNKHNNNNNNNLTALGPAVDLTWRPHAAAKGGLAAANGALVAAQIDGHTREQS